MLRPPRARLSSHMAVRWRRERESKQRTSLQGRYVQYIDKQAARDEKSRADHMENCDFLNEISADSRETSFFFFFKALYL